MRRAPHDETGYRLRPLGADDGADSIRQPLAVSARVTSGLAPTAPSTRGAVSAASAAIAAVAAITTVGACRELAGPADVGPPGLTIATPTRATDSAGAVLAQPLRVVVRGADGRPLMRVPVRFRALLTVRGMMAPSADFMASPTLRVASADSSAAPDSADVVFRRATWVDTTDARGVAEVRVRLGWFAGPAALSVSVPAIDDMAARTDTVHYAVRPGNAAGVAALPGTIHADTALTVGATLDHRPSVVDRYGNPLQEPVTITTLGDAIGLTGDGRIVGRRLGRAKYVVRARGWADSGRVSVVPEGTLAVELWDLFSARSEVAVVGLDGGRLRRAARDSLSGTFESGFFGTRPQWLPGGTHLVFHRATGRGRRLFVVEAPTAGAEGGGPPARELLQDGARGPRWFPSVTGDGAWIYYVSTRGDGLYADTTDLWRVRPDGTEPSLVARDTVWAEYPSGVVHWLRPMRAPAVSPDGHRVAYDGADGLGIRMLDLRTRRVVQSFGEGTEHLAWAPDGAHVAFFQTADPPPDTPLMEYPAAELIVARPDGSERRRVGDGRYVPPATWSGDGRFLVARSAWDRLLHVIDVEHGLVIPLPYSGMMYEPALRER